MHYATIHTHTAFYVHHLPVLPATVFFVLLVWTDFISAIFSQAVWLYTTTCTHTPLPVHTYTGLHHLHARPRPHLPPACSLPPFLPTPLPHTGFHYYHLPTCTCRSLLTTVPLSTTSYFTWDAVHAHAFCSILLWDEISTCATPPCLPPHTPAHTTTLPPHTCSMRTFYFPYHTPPIHSLHSYLHLPPPQTAMLLSYLPTPFGVGWCFPTYHPTTFLFCLTLGPLCVVTFPICLPHTHLLSTA